VAGLVLGLLGDLSNQPLARLLRSINVLIVEASVAHDLGQDTSIGGHSRDADTHVGVDLEHFLLVHGQIVRALFQSKQNLKS
jgi:hypothetical protein